MDRRVDESGVMIFCVAMSFTFRMTDQVPADVNIALKGAEALSTSTRLLDWLS